MNLRTSIKESAHFKSQYEALRVASAYYDIPFIHDIEREATILEPVDWNYLLSAASVFAGGECDNDTELVLTIAQTCIRCNATYPEQKNQAAFLLLKILNRNAVELSRRENFIDYNFADSFSIFQKLEAAGIDLANSINIYNHELNLNSLQSTIHNYCQQFESVSISAPTSSGKSFIISIEILSNILTNAYANVVHVVPSRALITQVSKDLKVCLSNFIPNIKTHRYTMPLPSGYEYDSDSSNIFVLTPERLHYLLLLSPSLHFDAVYVDEAQKIEDGTRGIILQSTIDDLTKTNRADKIVFCAPHISNPEIFNSDIESLYTTAIIQSSYKTVEQNIIYALYERKKWHFSTYSGQEETPLGAIESPIPCKSTLHREKIVSLALLLLSTSDGVLVYCNGPAQAEEYAVALAKLMHTDNSNIGEELVELINFTKDHIHPKYHLTETLKSNVAFHYGNMPSIVRAKIEELFCKGHIKCLFCTSTLLEGVNLPAKYIIINNPTRGKSKPMSAIDFWNLAGRAGRWGKEFSGAVVCVEPTKWDVQPPTRKVTQTVKRAIDLDAEKKQILLEYINGQNEVAEQSAEELDYLYSYYYRNVVRNDNIHTISDDICHAISISDSEINIPYDIINRNPSFSPKSIQLLYEHFRNNAKNIKHLIPISPHDSKAYIRYIDIFSITSQTISPIRRLDSSIKKIVTIALKWMRGQPLQQIISSSIAYYKNKDKKFSEHSHIREVLQYIENDVRYNFSHELSCYIDVLKFCVSTSDCGVDAGSIPDAASWLEFGVSSIQHIYLLSIGISRLSALTLVHQMPSNISDREECMLWLHNFILRPEEELKALGISKIIIEEVTSLIE